MVRSPEGLWPVVLPMTITMGFALHLPLLLRQWNLLPDWENFNLMAASLLVISTVIGASSSAFIYLSDRIAKPIQLKPKALQDFFAYDLYTAQLYKVTIVLGVGAVSQLVYWFDRYIIDGLVNLVGLVTIFSGESLKYNASGQTQFYVLTILVGVAILGIIIGWNFLSQISLVLGH